VEIRPAEIEDAAAICTVLRRSITELCVADHRNEQPVLDQWLANKVPETIKQWIANHPDRLLVAVAGKAILGVGCVNEAGEIMLNYVSPDAQFQGVSKAIMAALEAVAREQRHASCTLDSTETARRFYLGLGYISNGAAGQKFGLPNYPMIKRL
jgi:GNAT superfamily N-acetyltransferase